MAKNTRNSTRQAATSPEETKPTEEKTVESKSQDTSDQSGDESTKDETATADPAVTTTESSNPAEPEKEEAEEKTEEKEASVKKQDANDPISILEHGLAQYAHDMGPSMPQNSAKIENSQLHLRSMVGVLMGLEGRQFDAGMKTFLNVVREHRSGAFNERYLFRGFAALRVSSADRKRLESILSLILGAVDSANPRKVEGIDMDALFRNGISNNDEQQKLLAFFKG